MRNLYLGFIGLIAAVVLWHVVAPPEYTLASRIGKLLGTIEASWLDTRLEPVAEQKQTLAEIEAMIQRETSAALKALELEANIANRQIDSTQKSQIAKNVGANLSDVMCAVGMMGTMLGGPDSAKSSQELMQFCALSDEIRRDIVEDYRELNDGRTTLGSDFMQSYRDSQKGNR